MSDNPNTSHLSPITHALLAVTLLAAVTHSLALVLNTISASSP